MSNSKDESQSTQENKTVPGEEEQSSQTSSWWILVLIALCTVTTILDKRKRYPSTTPTELQDKQAKRGQIESSASDNGQVRGQWNPQILGNVALIVIQVALFALLQLSEHYEKFCDGILIKGAFLILLAVGTVLLTVTINESFNSVVIIVMVFLILAAFLNHAVPESGQEGVVWILIVTAFQAVSLGMAYRASTKLKSTWETA